MDGHAVGQASVTYAYDAAGNLASVTDQSGHTTTYAYQAAGYPHALMAVTNPAGATVLQAQYDPATGQLSALVNADGAVIPVSTAAVGPGEVAQTVVDAAGNVTVNVFGERYGTLDRTVRAVTDAAGTVTDYVVTVTRHDYATDDAAGMSGLYPTGVRVLQGVETFAPFDVPANDAGLQYAQQPDADGWVSQVVYDTSDDPADPAAGRVVSTSERVAADGTLRTTLDEDYVVTNQGMGTAQPRVTVVEVRTPDGASATGYDDRVQSTTYTGYDAGGNVTYSVTAVGRDVAGAPAGTPTLAGGYPQTLYLTLGGVSAGGGPLAVAWDPASGSYSWSYTQGGHDVWLRLADTSLAGRGAGATPVAGDAWTFAVSDASYGGGHGLVGTVSGLAFDGTPLGLQRAAAALLAGGHFHEASTGAAVAGSGGVSVTVPGWIATGTYTDRDGNGFVTGTEAVVARVDPDGTVHLTQRTATSSQANYGQGDYALVNNQWVPNPGAAYGAPRYTVDAAGQETYYAYDQSGRTVLQYVYKRWTTDAGAAVSGWVGTTSVYDSAGRLTDTYAATYRDASASAGQGSGHVLPVVAGGPAGLHVDTSVTPIYQGPLHTQHVDYNSLGQKADTVDQYGGTTAYTYDVNGNVIKTVNPDGTEQLTVYDALNRVIWSTNGFDPNNLSTAITTRTVYNQLGQVVETQQYAGQLVQLGTKTVGTTASPSTFVPTVDGTPGGLPTAGTLVSTTKTYYDAQGNAIETVGANGLRTGSVYTPDGKVLYTGPLTASAPDGGHTVTVNGGVTTRAFTTADFAYYSESDPVQYDNALGLFYTRSVDEDGHATLSYTDSQGRSVRTVYADGSFAETLYSVGTTAVSLDQEGDAVPNPDGWTGITGGGYEVVNVAQRKAGDTPVYSYDLYNAAGQLTDVWLAKVVNGATTSTTPVNPHWHYAYDAAGDETAQVSGDGNAAGANPALFTTRWAYDQNGNQVRQTLPDGELQTWTYDVYGDVTSHKVYSATDHTTALQTTLDTYDTSAAHGGRLVEEDRYASDQNAGTTATPDERTTYSDTFAYDLENNRTRKTEAPVAGQPATETITYSYNGDDQLETEVGSGTSTYTTQSGYDADGNLTSQTRTGYGAASSTYHYDLQNRMTSATVAGQQTTYTYDYNGVLTSETTAEATTYDLNDPNNPTGYSKAVQQSVTLAGSPTTSYVLGLGVAVQSDAAHGTLYLLVDGHGSTRTLADTTGAAVGGQAFDYDAYGDTLTNAAAAETNWLFGGDGVYDHATGWTSPFKVS